MIILPEDPLKVRAMISLLAAFLLLAPAFAQARTEPEDATHFAAKSLVKAHDHLIVAANPLAAQAGDRIMAVGGSAADAAIAALLVLNVVEPQSSGIGGGGFALVHGPDGLTTWDARETAPAGATPDLFMENGKPLPIPVAVASGRSIGVPGLVRLMEALHAHHGKLPWADLFQPAIRLARDGFEVSPRLANVLARYARLQGTDAATVFLPGGEPVAAGAILKQPRLAGTFASIAAHGANAFYTGPLAERIVAAARRIPRPGTLSLHDLNAYRVIERPAVCHRYRRYRICGMGPPSSGATTTGQILMLLDRFKLDDLTLEGPRLWHLFASASRLAYADRARYLADSDFVQVPIEGLLDPAYMDSRARLVNPFEAVNDIASAGDPPGRVEGLHAPDVQKDRPSTTHLSVVDKDGLAISLTASIEAAFGSGRMAGGFLLNNQLTDFSFRPTDAMGVPIANAPAPGKRPRSSMAPTIAYLDDKPVALTGSPGGGRIPEYVAQSLVAMLAFEADPAMATALPHVSQRNRGTVAIEPGMPASIVEGLEDLGHQTGEAEMTSGLHIIRILPDGTLLGGADPRREGAAIGR